MKRILDIGDLGAVYVEHETPLTKPVIYKPKPPSLPGGGFGPGANALVDQGLSRALGPPKGQWGGGGHGGGGTVPSRPRPAPATPAAPPSPAPNMPPPAPVAPPVSPASPHAESTLIPWLLGGVGLLLAGGIGWAIYRANAERREHLDGARR